MTKAVVYEPRKQEVEYGSHSKDSKRNYLGFIYKKDVEAFVQAFSQACKEQGETVEVWKRYGYERLTFSYSPLIAEVIELSKGKIGEVSILFEEPITGYAGVRMHSIKDMDRLMVFIGFNVTNKALTRLRKFLLEHVIEVQKETT
jgi:hypothetical protein